MLESFLAFRVLAFAFAFAFSYLAKAVQIPCSFLTRTGCSIAIAEAAVMAEVTISPSMPGENTKHSPMQEGDVPSMGHMSDPSPTSAGAHIRQLVVDISTALQVQTVLVVVAAWLKCWTTLLDYPGNSRGSRLYEASLLAFPRPSMRFAPHLNAEPHL